MLDFMDLKVKLFKDIHTHIYYLKLYEIVNSVKSEIIF